MDAKILNKKLELIQWLSTLEDTAVIEKLVSFRKEETKDWWDATSAGEKAAIEKGISDAEKEQLKPHSTARALYEKWL